MSAIVCSTRALGALLFVELGHFERLLALPAQLPTSLSHSVVKVLELNVTEVRVVGDDLGEEVRLLRRLPVSFSCFGLAGGLCTPLA